MAIHIHRSERTDTLLRGLAAVLAQTPSDSFTPDVIAVPTPGIERFISQGLGLTLGSSEGRTDGICANVDFPSPGALVNRVISQTSGIEPREDPWLPHRAVWPLLAVIDRSANEVWCEPLARHLGLLEDEPLRRDRRFAVASRLAGLFSTYGSQRPGLILDWARNDDSVVPDDLAWQPQLWRALREEIGVPSLAERLEPACKAVSSDPSLVELPARLSVFGASRLPADQRQVLAALGETRDVHLWLAEASPQTVNATSLYRRDANADEVRNPLLRSFGRDARELRQRLDLQMPDAVHDHLASDLQDGTMLGQLQCQIRDNTISSNASRDRSIQVHACHGQARQAEVVHEIVLSLLQNDPTLEARDILIMCPDLDAFAPLLSAAFCDDSLRLRIADRTPEQGNLVLVALATLLDLVTGRTELSTVLDFAAQPPVRQKFGFDDDALDRLAELTEQAGIRWGLDDQTRADFLVRIPTGTWAWGLDRMLLGVAMSEDGLPIVNGVLPVDDVNSGDVALVGQLAELITRLRQARDTLQGRHSASQWVATISAVLEDLTQVWGLDAWQMPNALAVVSGLAENAGSQADSLELSLADIRWLLEEVLTGRPTRSNFRSGDLTVCGLAPMRSVPHRVICLVGMDDGAFPRSLITDGDDILARDPLIGERDVRSEDRQLLLDAIMATTDTLVITYAGADERTNQPRPPCVPLGELLDTLETMAPGARDHVLVHHPLQPFDPRNFEPGALGSAEPFSHDQWALAAARRSGEPRTAAATALLDDLPPVDVTELSPQDLGTFLASPVNAFLRTRLGLSLREDDDQAPEQIPIALNGLTSWQVGNRSLRLLTRGESVDRVSAAEYARGELPPGPLGGETLRTVGAEALAIAEKSQALRNGQPRHVGVSIDLPNGVRVVGVVPDVYEDGIVRASFSKTKPKEELRIWAELLALAAARPDRTWTACLVTKDGGFRLTAPANAGEILAQLTDLYRSGLRSPLPLPPATASCYAKRRAEGSAVEQAMRAAQFGVWQRNANERELAEIVWVWGEEADFSSLTAEAPRSAENWFDEATRFGMLARRVWTPLLAAREDL